MLSLDVFRKAADPSRDSLEQKKLELQCPTEKCVEGSANIFLNLYIIS